MFAGCAVAANSGVVPSAPIAVLNEVSRWCLVIAISALGAKTSLGRIIKVKVSYSLILIVETLFSVDDSAILYCLCCCLGSPLRRSQNAAKQPCRLASPLHFAVQLGVDYAKIAKDGSVPLLTLLKWV